MNLKTISCPLYIQLKSMKRLNWINMNSNNKYKRLVGILENKSVWHKISSYCQVKSLMDSMLVLHVSTTLWITWSRFFVYSQVYFRDTVFCYFAIPQPQNNISHSYNNKKLYRTFSRQANQLILNIPVLIEGRKGCWGWIARLTNIRKADKLKMINYRFLSIK